jgi:hypothetical protein
MPRSFTHPLTNTVVLDKLNITTHLGDVMIGGLSTKVLPVFLHEVTHHWCFSSPVGTALSIIAIDARAKLVTMGIGDELEKEKIATDEIKYNTTLSILQPILEGLSLFAEFDLLPGDSQIVSLPTSISALMFLGRQNLGDKLFDNFKAGLQRYRVNQDFISRKTDLLYDSFDCNKSSYLAGYLFIKSQFNVVKRSYDQFNDADFFMHYYRSYIFDDWELVRLLLDPETSPNYAVEDIIEYIANRVSNFLQLDHSSSIKKFENDVLKQTGCCYKIENKWIIGEVFSVPIGECEVDNELSELLNKRVHDLFSFSAKEMDSMIYLIQAIIGFRGALHLGHAELKAKVSKTGWLSIYNNDVPLFAQQAPEEIGLDWEGMVEADIVYIPQPTGLYTIISKDGIPITSLSLSGKKMSKNELSYFLNSNEVLGAISILNSATKILESDEDYKEYSEYASDFIKININNLYCSNALIFTKDELIPKAYEIMFESGLYGIFNNDSLLNDCVLASLISSNYLNAKSEKLKDNWNNKNIEETIDEMNNIIYKHLGFYNFAFLKEAGVIHSNLL